ncbi:hypothetical protein [Candidatus Clostridium stratigraminis]|uniref:Uncharacterized protein n=1 Tax=Candidatus Clostridium stratigraminis TaxID=3381661 RepID=A0ABW8T256_9CLOT
MLRNILMGGFGIPDMLGGLSVDIIIRIDPYCNYGKENTKWTQLAEKRFFYHDMYPEKIHNR